MRSKRSTKKQDDAEIKFATYISKVHKQIHGTERTVSCSTLSTLDLMTDHLLNALVGNGKKVMRYGKTSTFNKSAASGCAALTLTGALKTSALGAGKAASESFASHKRVPESVA